VLLLWRWLDKKGHGYAVSKDVFVPKFMGVRIIRSAPKI